MRTLAKTFLFPFLKPLASFYLRKTRFWRYGSLKFKVFPGVFHPGLFLSTKVMMQLLPTFDLLDKKVLEVGSGSGAISVMAASRGAHVTALDLNPLAVENTRENAALNDLKVQTLHSDLFKALENSDFDLVVVNPPYYPKEPQNESELAWFCGSDFDFFQRFFSDLKDYLKPNGFGLMILSEDCALEKIQSIASNAGWQMEENHKKMVWGEWNLVFKIERSDT